ncbi:hypothetical protein VM1G_04563 [Cytospora mali]|uniref:ZN622/Rei1/Reh1 zinc finger C2H2-type domain-containing protein n=1 Tax=Cytospora mali TaxID=578113 RepID=A0A194VVW9_CYTMA|nr:hypothetical protein VM1G_04563 [Valsa mali]
MSQPSMSSSASATNFNEQSLVSAVLAKPGSSLDGMPNQASPMADTECLDKKLSSLDLANSDAEEDEPGSSDEDEAAPIHFDPTQCLFCNQKSASLAENMSHMQKRHGLIIPSPERLIVDIETLVAYLHLVVFEYAECLSCGSIRNTPQAAQQHMTGKGHCRIDITKENSEFRDFYNFDPESDSEEEEGTTGNSTVDRFVGVDEETRRLASGKLVSHRRARKPRVHQHVARIDEQDASGSLLEGETPLVSELSSVLTPGSKSKELRATEKRGLLFNKQLVTMRSGDRQALMHLPLSQQRTLVAKAKRQQEKWNRDQVAQEIKRQLKANPK